MKYLLSCTLLFLAALGLQAQQPAQYSTYMLDQIRFNPAYAGLDYGLSFTGTYRQQWSGLEGSPTGQRLSAHMPLYFLRGGFGIQVENDDIGAHRLTNAQLAYNYQMELGSGVLSLGVGGGWQQWTLRGGELITPTGTYDEPGTSTHNDDILTLATESGATLQFSTGLYYQSERLEAGVAVENINAGTIQLNQLNYTLARSYNAFAMTRFEVGNSLEIRPSVWFRTDAIENQLDISALAVYNGNIFGGASFRGYDNSTRDAVVVLAGFQLTPAMQLAYAYDIGLSPLKTVNSGSHEIVLKYRINKTFGAGVPPRIIYHPRSK
jgi:type IX secretion system PorP/SprF family membrane protein